MSEVVSAQVTIASEFFAAIVVLAHVWLFVCVRAHVRFQIASLVKDFFAHVTFVWAALLVDHFVYGQRSRLTKALFAHRTLKWFLVRVNKSE